MVQFSHLGAMFKHCKIFVMLAIAGVIICIVKPATSEQSPTENVFSERQISKEVSHKINTVIKQNGNKFDAFFGDDIVPNETDLASRNAGTCQNFLCKSDVKLVYPTIGTLRNKTKINIVNTDEYKQGVRVELCKNPGKSCEPAQHRKTECVQMHYLRKVVAIDLDTNTTFKEDALIPSGCGCVEVNN